MRYQQEAESVVDRLFLSGFMLLKQKPLYFCLISFQDVKYDENNCPFPAQWHTQHKTAHLQYCIVLKDTGVFINAPKKITTVLPCVYKYQYEIVSD